MMYNSILLRSINKPRTIIVSTLTIYLVGFTHSYLTHFDTDTCEQGKPGGHISSRSSQISPSYLEHTPLGKQIAVPSQDVLP
jgi:hypothetical protein